MMSSSVSEASSAGDVRTLRLVRRGTFGFSVRGGREHGTGFFVSAVEPGSDAHCQGLRVGDQIMRVNGFPVDNAIHQEVLQLVQRQSHIDLKVRTVGMIPVKDKCNDPLTWRLVEEGEREREGEPMLTRHQDNVSSVHIGGGESPVKDVRILLEVAAKTKLGCGICKGPDWRPGIFVQYTKEKGVAREAGLRPGDQILQCNGVPFVHTDFNQAVEVLKSARQLDLVIRKAAGLDLFPGESSGYNSSASSVNGDMSPRWGDAKRLSIVREEAMSEGDERLMQMDRASLFRGKQWNQNEQNGKEYFTEGKPTVIHIREAGRSSSENDLYNNGSNSNGKLAEICMISQQQETTTVIVEVHRSDLDDNGVPRMHNGQLSKSLSSNSFASASSSSSLGSALSQELQRRTQRKETDTSREQRRKTLLLHSVDEERHQKLMNEFKMAHKKMFKATQEDREPTPPVRPREVPPPAAPPLPPPPMPPDSDSNSSCGAPACPTPDYDNLSISSTSKPTGAPPTIAITSPEGKPSQRVSKGDGDRVEMISIESFTLNNPASPKPKPPATYFGSKKPKAAVAVTIGEYQTGVDRRKPSRFDFLGVSAPGGLLQSELAQTLSRSNLRKQTEPVENDLKGTNMESATSKETGTNCIISQTDLIHRKFTKHPTSSAYSSCVQTIKNMTPNGTSAAVNPSTNKMVDTLANNRVTIRIPVSTSDAGTGTLNGILKNAPGTTVTELNSGKHRSLFQQKSISFGEITTVINEPAPSHT